MKIAIVGAGFGGLAAAYDLALAGDQVEIFESAPYVGGLSAGFKDAGWDWSVEQYYHHWFASDRHMLSLIDELGWREKVRFPRPVTTLYHNGRFYPFDSIPAALMYPGLGWGVDKARFGLVGLYLRLTKNWKPLERFTAAGWMRKWAGRHVYETMWQPLLEGKFGERYASVVNMAWMWARFHVRTPRLGTFEGGFQAFADLFAEKLRSLGVTIHLSAPVSRITPQAQGGYLLETPRGAIAFDQALVTSSPGLLAKLAPDLPPGYLKGLLELKSMGAVILILALRQRLSREGYYWFSLPKSAGFPFLALVEHTNFTPPEHYGGDHIVYAGDYLQPDHEYFRLSQNELLGRFLPSFTRFNPDFKPDWVRKTWLFRTPYAQPVPMVNHSKNIPDIRTPLHGLYFASMSQVYPWDRGTNFAVQIARRAAALMLTDRN